jgi:predicted DNA-binding ribbon-helix-helix protein
MTRHVDNNNNQFLPKLAAVATIVAMFTSAAWWIGTEGGRNRVLLETGQAELSELATVAKELRNSNAMLIQLLADLRNKVNNMDYRLHLVCEEVILMKKNMDNNGNPLDESVCDEIKRGDKSDSPNKLPTDLPKPMLYNEGKYSSKRKGSI